MKRKIIGFFIFLILIGTITHTVIAKTNKDLISLNNENAGIIGGYRSIIDISSPDGNSFPCIMYCINHKKTIEWITQIDDYGFEKAWVKQFTKLNTFFIIPGTILFFGLDDFTHWYSDLFIKLRYKEEFLNFINYYDKDTGSGMITYKWISGIFNKPIDFKSQPDNTWLDNSWILDDYGKYIPNPEIWHELPYLPFLE
ncbi:hypothetical protein AYK20_03550 [Thermoplasmatales archaeon SG8-52-1]|nr:MAG: hypothetical protein AYK20_03550 [Thermoplasmatales archaeon SG8-52-1]